MGMEDDYFSSMPISIAGDQDISLSSADVLSGMSDDQFRPIKIMVDSNDCPLIKGEPHSGPCSPLSHTHNIFEDNSPTTMVSPHSIHLTDMIPPSESEDDEDMIFMQDIKLEQLDIPDEILDQTSDEGLPPTPPSSAGSDNESTVSASCSPDRKEQNNVAVQNVKGFMQPRLYVSNNSANQHSTTSTRHPIHTPLISCQPKGSTGTLVLTEEEKRTLIAEGYPVPTKLPLTKQEEKSLKKVRRKIKNKISAQESRRKKKEYMDGLERRVAILSDENNSYKERLTKLEITNRHLAQELQRLQAMLQQK